MAAGGGRLKRSRPARRTQDKDAGHALPQAESRREGEQRGHSQGDVDPPLRCAAKYRVRRRNPGRHTNRPSES